MAEKTEKATPKKLRDARKKGQVAKSQDLPSAFTFIVSVAAVLAFMGFMYEHIARFTITAFNAVVQDRDNLDAVIPSLFAQSVYEIFLISIPVLVLTAFVGCVVTFLTVGPMFSMEVFKPDIKKFDPIKNLKAKFKFKTLFELLKSLVKIAIAAYLIYGVMYKSLPVLIQMVSIPLQASLLIFNEFLFEVVWKVGLMFIVIAVADLVYQRRNFANEMKMEKFEVKQEYKNTEGDPQIKGKRKQIAQEIAYQDGPAQGVKKSKAVVSNPAHLAIAITYDKELDQAPWITTMGSGTMAAQIIKLAEEYKVPVLRNVPLAHKLWEQGELYDYVPEETYEVVADILRWVAKLEENAELGIEEEIEPYEG